MPILAQALLNSDCSFSRSGPWFITIWSEPPWQKRRLWTRTALIIHCHKIKLLLQLVILLRNTVRRQRPPFNLCTGGGALKWSQENVDERINLIYFALLNWSPIRGRCFPSGTEDPPALPLERRRHEKCLRLCSISDEKYCFGINPKCFNSPLCAVCMLLSVPRNGKKTTKKNRSVNHQLIQTYPKVAHPLCLRWACDSNSHKLFCA